MRTQIALLSKLAACAILVLGISGVSAADKKADPTGTWTWTMQRRGGGQGGNADAAPRKVTLKLKAEGDKLTGTMAQPAFRRGGGDAAPAAPVETKISNGKVNGDQISFDVTREFNGNSFTAKYSGKVEGDTINGKVETERNGQANSRDWVAKRDK